MPSYRERGSYYELEEDNHLREEFRGNPAYPLKEQLYSILEDKLGESNMTVSNMINAIGEGVGSGLVRRLQRMGKGKRGEFYLRGIMPNELYEAIKKYKKKR